MACFRDVRGTLSCSCAFQRGWGPAAGLRAGRGVIGVVNFLKNS